ncbi:sensor histidine kinase [Planotetraspora kaengkrachanensis]|uniref:histidine kinase n=1 Tax=Planotetraspora kaengkrachanensis TaxID=575193 RepID=A0A8J3PS33_9ACTN|nr:HAMP domain-containing sensor histidine kinase [Planotetraspora kaengkrachanensis]GIG79832.1 two-component sensor histidine kinase [Planotetraspora kaengkrachanensis]
MIASAVMLLVCAAAGAFVLISVRGTAEKYKTEEVVSTAVRVSYLIKRERLPPVILDEDVSAVQVVNPTGQIVSTSYDLSGRPRMAAFRPSESSAQESKVICRSPAYPDQCVIVVALRVPQSDGQWLAYAAGSEVPWYVSSELLMALIGSSLLLIGLTAFGTYQTVGRALSPVEAIADKLAVITTTDLGQRVPVPKYRDEIRRLAETANQTLDRAELAVEQQRRFASDASHDLRSPLTAMRTEIEEALLHPESTDWLVTSDALLDSLDRLQALVTDLLQIARLDAGAAPKLEHVDLADLATRELDRRQRKVDVARELEPGVVVVGDRLRLARLLNNLLDNAERHAASLITVRVRLDRQWGALEVVDDGAGIPADQREMVFERFTRLDAARSKDAGGTGLGLSIARQIAESHRGTLKIEDSSVGARFVLRLPMAGGV